MLSNRYSTIGCSWRTRWLILRELVPFQSSRQMLLENVLSKSQDIPKRPYLPKGFVKNSWNRTQMDRGLSCILVKGRCVVSLTISQTHPFSPKNCSILAQQGKLKEDLKRNSRALACCIIPHPPEIQEVRLNPRV